MPIFEYVCEECRRPFEKLVRKREETVCCPACGSGRYTLAFSVIAAPVKSNSGETAGSSCACTPTTCGCN